MNTTNEKESDLQLIDKLWESDTASALTNRAARKIEKLRDAQSKLYMTILEKNVEIERMQDELGKTNG